MFKIILYALTLFNAAAFAKSPPTVGHVDLNRYIGKWYEVASIPQSFQKQCVKNVTAEYSFTEKNRIKVINSCDQSDGSRDQAVGRAKVVDSETNAKLRVTFVKIFNKWIFPLGGNYWILDLADDYSYSLVGDPTLEYAWILTRAPQVSKEVFINAESKFKLLGYDTCKILTSVQTAGVQQRIPLCQFVQ